MTVATRTKAPQTVDQAILDELEMEFGGLRSRIASLSVEAAGTLTSVFGHLGPQVEFDVKVIEWEQFELELVAAA